MLACAQRKQGERRAPEYLNAAPRECCVGHADDRKRLGTSHNHADSSARKKEGLPARHVPKSDRRQSHRQAARPLWDCHQLNSAWDEVKESYCGKLGKVTRLDKIGSQVEIEFRDGVQPVRRLVYPLDAVGMPVARGQPMEDACALLRMNCGAMGHAVQVRDDVAFVRQCFSGHSGNIPFVEELVTDMHALRNCAVIFATSFSTAIAAEQCGSWFHLIAVLAWVAIAYDVIYHERIRCRRIEVLSEREVDQQQRLRSAIPDEETVDWANGVLWKLWSPMQRTVAKQLHRSLQTMVRIQLPTIVCYHKQCLQIVCDVLCC